MHTPYTPVAKRSLWARLPIGFYLLGCLAFWAGLAYLLFF